MLTIDYILVILSQVCKFSDSLLYGVFLAFSLFFSIFLLFSRFFTYFVNLTEIERYCCAYPPYSPYLSEANCRITVTGVSLSKYRLSIILFIHTSTGKALRFPSEKEQRSWQLYRRPLLSVSVYQCTLHNPRRAVLPR